MIEKIKKILESQIGKKNSITSKEIAKKMRKIIFVLTSALFYGIIYIYGGIPLCF